jgi:dihydrofolate synthase/folylpolyglutamate synthase
LPKNASYYFTKANIPRALNEMDLQAQAATFELFGKSYPSVKLAIDAAKAAAKPNDLIFIGGSTFIVAEAV